MRASAKVAVVVFVVAAAALASATGDLGLTYDEPAYRYSQDVSIQWWERLARAHSAADLAALFDADALLYYWPYGRHGINFHPPLSGQLNLLTYGLFGGWMKDIPARRMASALELAATAAFWCAFLGRRYGLLAGLGAAGSLLLMPRVFGQALLIDTDTPGLLLWTLALVAFWKALHDPERHARRARVALGVLVGLAFVQKMATAFVLLPILGWLLVGHLPAALRRGRGEDRLDGLLTLGPQLLALGVAFLEVRRVAALLPPPGFTDLFVHRPPSRLPGAFLALPLVAWAARRALARWRPRSPLWGPSRPALEALAAILAFGPAVAWLGNPAWWRETFTRLAHYYLLLTRREGALPDIRILYAGEIYTYSLPWPNAPVLVGLTVPASLLVAAALGLGFALSRIRRGDRLPLFVLLNLATLPALRMLPTPAHDGVRLLLPTLACLAALSGWGIAWAGAGLAGRAPAPVGRGARLLVAAIALLPAAAQLARVHPYELSYYNEPIGGPDGAWRRGFELSYWYDAFHPRVLEDLGRALPPGAALAFPNELSAPSTFQELQSLGHLRRDLFLGVKGRDRFPHFWLLTHDSKADGFSRLLFQMTPLYASRPRALSRDRVLAVMDPEAGARAWALHLLAAGPDATPRPAPRAPGWVRRRLPPLARLWGDGLAYAPRPTVREEMFTWEEDDPQGLRDAAVALAEGRRDDPGARRLAASIEAVHAPRLALLLRANPRALVDAANLLIARGDAVRRALEHPGYLDPATLGGPLDEGLLEAEAGSRRE
jgi:hypothetical protein